MTDKVKYSPYSIVITIIGMAIFITLMILELRRGEDILAYLVAGALVVLCFAALYYAPISITVDGKTLTINRTLRSTAIPLADIESVKKCPPTMAERRICGSGGWFGYWGRFYEPSIGKYFAYYGKASDCFLVKLKSGKQYLIGCENPSDIIENINQIL